jgi:hypothetical protein
VAKEALRNKIGSPQLRLNISAVAADEHIRLGVTAVSATATCAASTAQGSNPGRLTLRTLNATPGR